MKKVIITGANGFVGSWLCSELSQIKVEVTAIVRSEESSVASIKDLDNVNIKYCSMENIKQLPLMLESKDYDTFIHLAWEGAGGAKRADVGIQLMNAKHTCDSAIVANSIGCSRFVTVGTLSEYIAKSVLSVKTSSNTIIYGVAKNSAHMMLDVVCNSLGLKYNWLVLSNLYGPKSINGNIVGYTLAQFARNKTPEFSSGNHLYDLLYVEDVVRAIIQVAQTSITKNVYYIGSGSPRLLKDYILSMKSIYDNGCEVRLGVRDEDPFNYLPEWFDINDLVEDTGFKARISFEEGIRRTISWIKENIEHVV